MKRLLLIWIFSGSFDGIAQIVDSTVPLREYNWSQARLTREHPYITGTVDGRSQAPRIDTLRSVLLVTSKPPAFTHAVYGYCVRRDGVCVGHLDNRGRLFKLPVRVWGCDSNQNKK